MIVYTTADRKLDMKNTHHIDIVGTNEFGWDIRKVNIEGSESEQIRQLRRYTFLHEEVYSEEEWLARKKRI